MSKTINEDSKPEEQNEILNGHLDALKELEKEVINTVPNGTNGNIINGIKLGAIYHSTACNIILIEKLHHSSEKTENILNSVQGILDKSDKKARWILASAVVTFFLSLVLLFYTIYFFKMDEPYKENLIELNRKIDKHLEHIDSVITTQPKSSNSEPKNTPNQKKQH